MTARHGMARRWIAVAVLLAAARAMAAPRVYALPEETAALLPGPNMDIVASNCGACHSSDYISTQPRPLANPRAFWTAEVAKMRQAYGAPLDAADVPKIVDYLVETYGQ